MKTVVKKLESFFFKNLDKITLLSAISLGGEKALIYLAILMLLFTLTNSKKTFSFANKFFDKITNIAGFDNESDSKVINLDSDDSDKNPDEFEVKLRDKILSSEGNNLSSIEKKASNIKKNIQLFCNKNTKKTDPYENEVNNLKTEYDIKNTSNDFVLNVSNATCTTPIYNLRTYKDLNFYYNLILHDFSCEKINNLIMVKDIQNWMSSSSLSNDDLPDEFCPLYFILKDNSGAVTVHEYLKVFIHTDDNNAKVAFVSKGSDYLVIKQYTDELINKGLIKDLLDGKHYTTYNLLLHESVNDFLDKILSLVLLPDSLIGDQVTLDIENFCENKKQYHHFFNSSELTNNQFNTSI